MKQGNGVYMWMGPASEEDETLVEKSRYEGNYKDGQKHGFGKMKFPNGDIYEGEWVENKVTPIFDSNIVNQIYLAFEHLLLDARRRNIHI